MNSTTSILNYLARLKQNNHREWYLENKKECDELRTQFQSMVGRLIQEIAKFDPDVQGLEPRDTIFRLNRDVRFSHDKSPYKTHFAAYIASGGRKSERAGYYIHLEPGDSILCAGIWQPQSPLLRKLRQTVYENMDELIEMIDNPNFKSVYPEFWGDTLKKLPPQFARLDCARPELLKRKDYIVICNIPSLELSDEDWITETIRRFHLAYPFNRFLNFVFEE